MKRLGLALLALAPLAAGAQDSTRTAASPSWLKQVASRIEPRPMRWRAYPLRLEPVRITLRIGQREKVWFPALLPEPPQVHRARDDERDEE